MTTFKIQRRGAGKLFPYGHCLVAGCCKGLKKEQQYRCEEHQKRHQEEVAEVAGTQRWAEENPNLVD